MLALGLIVIGILLRFLVHAPNFTPVAAIALFSGVYLDRKGALLAPLALMVISDLFLGLHNVVFFTWGAFALISLMGLWLKKRKTALGVAGMSLASSLVFYIVSNFGVWLMGWYPRTAGGLVDCYLMGLPFLRDFTAGTLFYTAVFFGAHELAARLAGKGRFAKYIFSN